MTATHRRQLPALPDLHRIRHIHIIGICGTAMGTLAAMLKERGYVVSGSDAMAYPPMSTWLESRGLVVQSGYDAAHIPSATELVVVGNVSRANNPEAVATLERGLPFISLPEALRVLFFPAHTCLVATGTHGKTTTTAITAKLLDVAGADPSFFVGGVTVDFDANYRLGSGAPFVVEGDEYDTAYFDKVPKFWHYPAYAATINNVEFDHADIYPDLSAIRHVFERFAAQLPADGVLWANGDDPVALSCAAHAKATVRTFGLGRAHDRGAEVLRVDESGTHIAVFEHGVQVAEALVPLIGSFNVRNALGAVGLCEAAGVPRDTALAALPSYRGVKKRQETKGVARDVLVIDDFAHHPTAVAATLSALRERYGERRLIAVFEAKSNTSRRAIFQAAYPPAFAAADVVVLSQPWREDSLPADQLLSFPQLVSDISALGPDVHAIPEVDDIVAFLAETCRPGDVVAGLSGSAFSGFHDKLLTALRRGG